MLFFLLRILLIAALSFVGLQYFPWWSVVAMAAIVSLLFGGRGVQAFSSSFIGVLLVWVIWSFTLNSADGGYLGKKVAELLTVNSPVLLMIIAGILVGLTAGFGGLCGQSLRQLLYTNEKSKKGYYRG